MKTPLDFTHKIDAHFNHIWSVYEEHLAGRGILNVRIRSLAIIGQCVTMGEDEETEAQVRLAIDSAAAAPIEILEVILQARIYVGKPRTDRALKRFFAVCEERNIAIEELTREIGPDGWQDERNLADERKRWLVDSKEFPQRDAMVEKYGWEGMSIGMMMQPANFPSVISKCDAIDPSYAKPWIDVVHAGMYARPVLSQKDRTLIMIANVVSIGEFTQARFHMTNAIKLGIPPKEVLEICWLATLYAGMPKLYSAFMLKEVLDELGVGLDG
jgi:4-carboxymuconolactone decarboxylase